MIYRLGYSFDSDRPQPCSYRRFGFAVSDTVQTIEEDSSSVGVPVSLVLA
jgi:hypothetical protein